MMNRVDTSVGQRPVRIQVGCSFPDCVACSIADAAHEPLSERAGFLAKRLFALVHQKRDPAFLELCLHQVRGLAKSIMLSPSSMASSITSPAHMLPSEDGADSLHPSTDILNLRDPSRDPRSPGVPATPVTPLGEKAPETPLAIQAAGLPAPEGILSPSTREKQREVDFFIDAGIGEFLVSVLAKHAPAPVITETALNALRDLVLSNTRDEIGARWLLDSPTPPAAAAQLADGASAAASNYQSFFEMFPALLRAPSTVVSSALDLLIATIGTTSAAHTLDEDQIGDLVVGALWVYNESTPENVLASLAADEYQVSLLGVQVTQVSKYAPRWALILQDKAILALCTIVKACFDRPRAVLERIASLALSQILDLVRDIERIPAQYPETDVFANALISLAILAPHLTGDQVAETSGVLIKTVDVLLAESPDRVIDAFGDLDAYLPRQLLPAPARIQETLEKCMSLRSQCQCLAVHTLAGLTDRATSGKRPKAIFDTLYKVTDAALPADLLKSDSDAPASKPAARGTASSVAAGSRYFEKTKELRARSLLSASCTKTLRRGRALVTVLVAVPALDSAMLACLNSDAIPRAFPRHALKYRLDETRALAKAAFGACAMADAAAYFGAAVRYAGGCGHETCGLASSLAECLLALGKPSEAIVAATQALTHCSKEHAHYAATQSRVTRARKALEKLGSALSTDAPEAPAEAPVSS
ncbi:hypothetical protein H9P43_004581 [Blastocladiella emersonii ATCC 22665]|nr:hypothetical protein H9P43_004581 [Blastocladiella emersonii ATCC 22665]